MIRANHTPGPWLCVAAEFGDPESDNEGLVAFWVRMPEVVLCKPDANLISAAPELLAALKIARANLHFLLPNGIEEQIDAAISKAEGI